MSKPTYNYCGVCGRVPHDDTEEPNYGPIRWWGPDDGWKIGTLCRWCKEEKEDEKPSPEDYAYSRTNGVLDAEPDTDQDYTELLQ